MSFLQIEKRDGLESASTVTSRLNIASLLGALGKMEDALAMLNTVEKILVNSPDGRQSPHSLENVLKPRWAGSQSMEIKYRRGEILNGIGDLDGALILHEEVLAYNEAEDLANIGVPHQVQEDRIARSKNTVGKLLACTAQDTKRAYRLLTECKIASSRMFGPDHLGTADIDRNLALAYAMDGDAKTSIDLATHALHVYSTNYDKEHFEIGQSHVILGHICFLLGSESIALYAKSLHHFNEAVTIIKKTQMSLRYISQIESLRDQVSHMVEVMREVPFSDKEAAALAATLIQQFI